jgi:3-deoxy-7-phosphoheptulonate synthase
MVALDKTELQPKEKSKPYRLVERKSLQHKTIIEVKGLRIGGSEILALAGPCAVESLESLRESAKQVKASGAKILRASAYKPRSSPYSFQGLGLEGLKILRQVADELDLVVETEVMDPRDVLLVAQYVDILRIGSRNMQNFDLLKEVGKCGKPVILKRGLSATIEEWLLAAEYIMAHGNHEVILCERGIRTFESATRNTLDISAVALAKELSHLPVIVDPSHAAGRRDIIIPLSMAAISAGADGLLVEVHHDPENAICDGAQSLPPEQFEELMRLCSLVAESIGRKMRR